MILEKMSLKKMMDLPNHNLQLPNKSRKKNQKKKRGKDDRKSMKSIGPWSIKYKKWSLSNKIQKRHL